MTSFVLASLFSLTAAAAQPTQTGEFTARLNDGWMNNAERWSSMQLEDGARRWGFGARHLLRLTVHDGSRAYVSDIQQQSSLSVDDLVKMRIHGVTADFIRQSRELGFKDLSIDDLVKMRIHRVTPEYVKEMRDLGFKDLTVEQLVKARIHRVTPAFVREIRDLGFKNLTLDDYARMSIHGVTPEFIKEVRSMGFKARDADEVVELAIHGKKWLKLLKDTKSTK